MKAWMGDWYARIKQRVRERGFDTVTAFVDTQPTTYLVELARQLGEDDVAASQLERMLILEAEDAGTIQRCVRNLLVRELHENLPEGWQTEWNGEPLGTGYRFISAICAVLCELPERYEAAFCRVEDALWDAPPPIPEGWLPANPDDPFLVEVFEQYWDAPADTDGNNSAEPLARESWPEGEWNTVLMKWLQEADRHRQRRLGRMINRDEILGIVRKLMAKRELDEHPIVPYEESTP